MSLGKSHIHVTIPLNLPNPRFILPLKFSRLRNSGELAKLQSAVVQEYISKKSPISDILRGGNSVRLKI